MDESYSIKDFAEDLYKFQKDFVAFCTCRRDLKLFNELFKKYFSEYPQKKEEFNGT